MILHYFHGMRICRESSWNLSERQIADSLQAEARNAYAQIVSKKYFADMVDAGVQTICKYGIAFYKEDVAVYTEG